MSTETTTKFRVSLASVFCGVLAGCLLVSPSALAAEGDTAAVATSDTATFGEALRGGKFDLGLRYRFEAVEDQGFRRDGLASTLRTTLAYRTNVFRGWSAFVELEDVTDIGWHDEHNNVGAGSLANGVTNRPVIADPSGTEVNQVYLRWASDRLRLDFGRQEIVLSDWRFVGNVGWRQNHQSFDAIRLEADLAPKIELTYAYLDRVNRINGGDLELAGHVVEGRFEAPFAKITVYGQQLDYDASTQAFQDRQTLGVELKGKTVLANLPLTWEAEYARQQDAADSPLDFAADYLHGALGLEISKAATFRIGYELLGSDRGVSFQTPLATLHKFNGWADRFLTTPAAGLEDLYLRYSGSHGPWAWTAVLHQFQSDTGGPANLDFGDELDVELKWKSPWTVSFGAKAARFESDTSNQVTKVWLWASTSI